MQGKKGRGGPFIRRMETHISFFSKKRKGEVLSKPAAKKKKKGSYRLCQKRAPGRFPPEKKRHSTPSQSGGKGEGELTTTPAFGKSYDTAGKGEGVKVLHRLGKKGKKTGNSAIAAVWKNDAEHLEQRKKEERHFRRPTWPRRRKEERDSAWTEKGEGRHFRGRIRKKEKGGVENVPTPFGVTSSAIKGKKRRGG